MSSLVQMEWRNYEMNLKLPFFAFVNRYRIVYAFSYVLASLTGVTRGYFYTVNLSLGLLILWEVFWLAMFVNLFNLGYMSRKHGKILLTSIFLLILISAFPIFIERGIIIILVGIFGILFSFFYTASPVNLDSKGLSEVTGLISFFMISYFSAYIMTQNHSGDVFLLAVTVGLSGFLIRVAVEKDFSDRFGISDTIQMIFATLGVFYTLIVFLLIRYREWSFLLLFLTLPISWHIVRTYQKTKDEFNIRIAGPLLITLSISHSILISIAWILVFLIH